MLRSKASATKAVWDKQILAIEFEALGGLGFDLTLNGNVYRSIP